MNGEAEPKMKFTATVTLGNVLNIIMVIAAGIGYIRHDAARQAQEDSRIQVIEAQQADDHLARQNELMLIQKETKVLDLLQQRLEDFPLHRHVGDKIFYPGGDVGELHTSGKLRH